MARPKCARMIGAQPGAVYFKPRGIPLVQLEEVGVTVDEFEAIRLADLEGMYQETAATVMGISRPTFGRILDSAHRKIAQALVGGLAIRIEGGTVTMADRRTFQCRECKKNWEEPFGTGRPAFCPHCGGGRFGRIDAGGGPGRGGQGACRGRGGKTKRKSEVQS